jgi:hypothetical protein
LVGQWYFLVSVRQCRPLAIDIAETPSFGIDVETEYILAMANMNGGVKTLLDVDGLLGG